MGFNPIQDGDWQGLNIMLEKLFFTKAEAGNTKSIVKKTGSVSARKTVTIKNDSSREIADGSLAHATVKVVDDGQSAALYVDGGADENVTIPDTGVVYKTQAKIAVPSSYFLDLRGIWKTVATQQYTADVAVLHDVDGNTVTLTTLDETNNVGTAGPIAGGRDQSGAFSANSWIHFFFIYNPITKDVSSLSSASPTAPTLPSGYTFFVRTGAVRFLGSSQLNLSYQMDNVVYLNLTAYMSDAAPSSAGVLETRDIADRIPATAKMMHGFLGITTNATGLKGMKVASDASGGIVVGATLNPGTYDVDYGFVDAFRFSLPVLTAQTIWWTAVSTASIYALAITGYTDDL